MRFESTERWRERKLAGLPARWAKSILSTALDKERELEREREANLYILDTVERIGASINKRSLESIPLDASDADVCAFADRRAEEGMRLLTHLVTADALRPALNALCEGYGVTPPGEKVKDGPAIARMVCAQWWRRKMRRSHARAIEAEAIRLGYVHLKAGKYISDESLRMWAEQKRRNIAMLENTSLVNDDTGEVMELMAIAEKSVANPLIRRGELMVRIRGFEECAKRLGHVAEFITITCPSRMHARKIIQRNGQREVKENASFDGATPKHAAQYLGATWARIRAKLARNAICVYGFRIAEPHHDGCPHWHLLLFTAPEHVPQLREIIYEYALKDSPQEEGAEECRTKFEAIDMERGSAAGYIAKYISKNIDGYQVGTDLFGGDAVEGSARVQAWASRWGIRQFQQIGGPPVGVWREMRRVKAEDVPATVSDVSGFNAVPTVLHDAFAAVQKTEERGADFGAFIDAYGGPAISRKDGRIKLHKAFDSEVGRYGEEKGFKPSGVDVRGGMVDFGGIVGKMWSASCRVIVESVRASWSMVRRGVAVDFDVALPPRTRVNNCTESREGVSEVEGEPLSDSQKELEAFGVAGASTDLSAGINVKLKVKHEEGRSTLEKIFSAPPFWWEFEENEAFAMPKAEKISESWLSGERLNQFFKRWEGKHDGSKYSGPIGPCAV